MMDTLKQPKQEDKSLQKTQFSWEIEEVGILYRIVDYYLWCKGVPEKNKALAIELLRKAVAEQDHLEADFLLGVCYEWGLYVGEDWDKARKYYTAADPSRAQKGNKAFLGLTNSSHKPIPDIEILVKSYDENEFAADREYRGKIVRTIGIASKIGKDSKGKAYIILFTERDDLPGVICFFEDEKIEDVVKLRRGSKYAVQGKVEGLVEGNVVLQDCKVVYEI